MANAWSYRPEVKPPIDALLLTPAEAAKVLSMGARTLLRLKAAGEIAFVQRGRSIRYAVSDLYAFIQANRTCKSEFAIPMMSHPA